MLRDLKARGLKPFSLLVAARYLGIGGRWAPCIPRSPNSDAGIIGSSTPWIRCPRAISGRPRSCCEGFRRTLPKSLYTPLDGTSHIVFSRLYDATSLGKGVLGGVGLVNWLIWEYSSRNVAAQNSSTKRGWTQRNSRRGHSSESVGKVGPSERRAVRLRTDRDQKPIYSSQQPAFCPAETLAGKGPSGECRFRQTSFARNVTFEHTFGQTQVISACVTAVRRCAAGTEPGGRAGQGSNGKYEMNRLTCIDTTGP